MQSNTAILKLIQAMNGMGSGFACYSLPDKRIILEKSLDSNSGLFILLKAMKSAFEGRTFRGKFSLK